MNKNKVFCWRQFKQRQHKNKYILCDFSRSFFVLLILAFRSPYHNMFCVWFDCKDVGEARYSRWTSHVAASCLFLLSSVPKQAFYNSLASEKTRAREYEHLLIRGSSLGGKYQHYGFVPSLMLLQLRFTIIIIYAHWYRSEWHDLMKSMSPTNSRGIISSTRLIGLRYQQISQ